MEATFINREKSEKYEPHKFILNLSQKLDIRSLNRHVALQNLSVNYTQKNIKKQYKNSRLKIIAPT